VTSKQKAPINGESIYICDEDFCPQREDAQAQGGFCFTGDEWRRILDPEDECEGVVLNGSFETVSKEDEDYADTLSDIEEGEGLHEVPVWVDGTLIPFCYVEAD